MTVPEELQEKLIHHLLYCWIRKLVNVDNMIQFNKPHSAMKLHQKTPSHSSRVGQSTSRTGGATRRQSGQRASRVRLSSAQTACLSRKLLL